MLIKCQIQYIQGFLHDFSRHLYFHGERWISIYSVHVSPLDIHMSKGTSHDEQLLTLYCLNKYM